ncbi:MAG: thioredoxin family protein [Deltaproteobacteria bacterium]|nr:thioredoxin family protein [Deltaproteobacteria bacterium]
MTGRSRLVLSLLLAAVAFALPAGRLAPAAQTKAPTAGPTDTEAMAQAAPIQTKKVTFLELGSVGCRPCDAMRPVMDSVRQKYGKQVEVTFHDVRKNPRVAEQYRIFLIPTQVFLNAEGREVFRHEGFLALEKVEAVLRQMGVQ